MKPIRQKAEAPPPPPQTSEEDIRYTKEHVERLVELFNETVLPKWGQTRRCDPEQHLLYNNYVRDLGGELCQAIEIFNRAVKHSGASPEDIQAVEDQNITILQQIRRAGQNVVNSEIKGPSSKKRQASVAHVVNCANTAIMNIKNIPQ